MKFLLVDDSRTMRTIHKRSLETLGQVEFFEARDGIEALNQMGSGPFDLMLIDWNMPNMDGITLVGRIRMTDKKTPLIMVTSESERSHVVEALKAGANNYVVKPFTPETLLEKVRQTLSKVVAA